MDVILGEPFVNSTMAIGFDGGKSQVCISGGWDYAMMLPLLLALI